LKNTFILVCLIFLASCNSNPDESFKEIYQKEICDKYSLYANSKNLNGSLSLYADDAIVNNNAVEPIVGLEKIKKSFEEWYSNTKTIKHSAKVISAKRFGNEAFVYGKWEVDQIMNDGSRVVETGHWSTHNVKVGNNWKMTIDHTNDAKFYESRKNN
tara:strand:+ start:913 stop:1383 length:471 start_codon:yes stop_codon:yes gene_type:complete